MILSRKNLKTAENASRPTLALKGQAAALSQGCINLPHPLSGVFRVPSVFRNRI
jgi:hypothetical protein